MKRRRVIPVQASAQEEVEEVLLLLQVEEAVVL